MKVLFVGYGSIAKRHIANLSTICKERKEELFVDLLRHAPASAPDLVRLSTCNIEELDNCYDAIFITNPTSEHEASLLSLLDKSNSFFVEKPVFSRSGVDTRPFLEGDKCFYVACPLRYSAIIQWVKTNISTSDVIGLRAISSSYLPDWRPGTDYRCSYSAHAHMGGGVHIDLIHEWDYIVHLLGFPNEVKSIVVKRSLLEIDSSDTAIYIADWGDKTAEVHLDYYGRYPIRRLDIFCAEETYSCDLLSGRIDMLLAGKSVELAEDRDAYQIRELEHFLAIAARTKTNDNDVLHAVNVMRLVEGSL